MSQPGTRGIFIGESCGKRVALGGGQNTFIAHNKEELFCAYFLWNS